MSKQFTLGKNERLKSRKQIEKLFAEGRSIVVSPFRIYYLFDEMLNAGPTGSSGRVQGPSDRVVLAGSMFNVQFGVGVSSKNFKRSVDRNRIKRLTREAWRLQKNELKELLKASNKQLNVFFIYTGKELPDFGTVKDKVAIALKKLSHKVNENNPANS